MRLIQPKLNTPLPNDCDYLHLETDAQVDTLIGIQRGTLYPNEYKIDSIPYHSPTVHLWDVVRVEWRWGQPPLIAEVLRPSGFKTLRIGWHRFGAGQYVINGPLNPQDAWAKHPIHGEWAALGLTTGERWMFGDRVEGAVFAVPPSFNLSRIALLKKRHPDLCIEMV